MIICVGVALFLLSEGILLFENRVMSAKLKALADETASPYDTHTVMTMMDLMENCGLLLDDCLLTAPDGEESLLQDCLSAGKVLVCRFSQYDCSLCVDYAVERAIEALSKDSLHMPLVLLGNYSSPAQVKALASRLDPDSRCLIYNSSWLDLPVDSHGQPYYFLVDSACHVSCVFTPDRMDPGLTDYYFNTLKRR